MGRYVASLAGVVSVTLLMAGCATGNREPLVRAIAEEGGATVMATGAASGDDPYGAGRAAAEQLRVAMGGVAPQAVVLMESYEGLRNKRAVVRGVASVFGKDVVFGGASYGGFTQSGSVDWDGVVLLGIGGPGVGVTAALSEKMGAAGLSLEENEAELKQALNAGGAGLAEQMPGVEGGSFFIVIGDAHSPKNQLLIDGVQSVAGKKLPITGGSVCKNAGQNWVYFRGKAYTDSAIGLLVTCPLRTSQAGRQAKSNEKVISTAREGAATALEGVDGKAVALLAFNCGGRKGKLDRLDDELAAIQASVGKEIPVFGAYCAGEFGPADIAESAGDPTSCGRGWHVMFTALGR